MLRRKHLNAENIEPLLLKSGENHENIQRNRKPTNS